MVLFNIGVEQFLPTPLFSGPLAGRAHKLVSSNILFYFMHQFRNGNAFYFRCWQLGLVLVTEGESYRVLSQDSM